MHRNERVVRNAIADLVYYCTRADKEFNADAGVITLLRSIARNLQSTLEEAVKEDKAMADAMPNLIASRDKTERLPSAETCLAVMTAYLKQPGPIQTVITENCYCQTRSGYTTDERAASLATLHEALFPTEPDDITEESEDDIGWDCEATVPEALARTAADHDKLTDTPDKMRLYQQERTIRELTEVICVNMEAQKMSRTRLADDVEIIEANLDDMLDGEWSMNVRTAADIFTALGKSLHFRVGPLSTKPDGEDET